MADHDDRKRVLEHNRRSLINERFFRLGKELQRSKANYRSGTAAKMVMELQKQRMDKEAILREATELIARRDKELECANTRIENLLSQVTDIREKLNELRKDKQRLYDEIKKLRNRNSNLWTHAFPSKRSNTLPIDFAFDFIPEEVITDQNDHRISASQSALLR